MKKQALHFLLLLFFFAPYLANAQEVKEYKEFDKTNPLFISNEILPVRFNYSIQELKSSTNDSTYLESKIWFLTNNTWDSLDVKMRVRGNFRLQNCYFPPLKLKIKKSDRKNTIFEKDKKLKLVMSCLKERDNNDNILKEYIAYKFYEIVSPYHFKTRLLDIDLIEQRRKKEKEYILKGFFIEDIDELVDRYDANEVKKPVHPMAQDQLTSVRNDFFQFMIGNTDYSSAYRHNGKLMFLKGSFFPIPYDFDMSGIVNPSYGGVAIIQGEPLPIENVAQRLYRGFKRDSLIYEKVRKEFLQNQVQFMNIMDSVAPFFENPSEFEQAKEYVQQFFAILTDDKSYQKSILAMAREK